MKIEEILQRVEGLPGWMSESDCFILNKYAERVKNGLIVEIGSYGGISTSVLALSSPSSKVVVIDPYIGFEEIFNIFLEQTSDMNIELIKKDSHKVGKTWNRNIDLIHIDGDHSLEGVCQDIESFIPFLKQNEFALFHDYPVKKFGVADAINELGGKYFSSIVGEEGFAVCRKK